MLQELSDAGEAFSQLMAEYGRSEDEDEAVAHKETQEDAPEAAASEEKAVALMQEEERNTGAVSWATYREFLRYGGGMWWLPVVLLPLVLSQVAQGNFLSTLYGHMLTELAVGNALFLGFWTAESVPGFSRGDYMAVYASFGVAQALFSFMTTFSFASVPLPLHQKLR